MTKEQASSELREIAARAKALTTAIDVHAVSAGTVHAAALEAMCSLSGGMLRLIKSFGEPLLSFTGTVSTESVGARLDRKSVL